MIGIEDMKASTYHRVRRIAYLLAHELIQPLAILTVVAAAAAGIVIVVVLVVVGHDTGDYERHVFLVRSGLSKRVSCNFFCFLFFRLTLLDFCGVRVRMIFLFFTRKVKV